MRYATTILLALALAGGAMAEVPRDVVSGTIGHSVAGPSGDALTVFLWGTAQWKYTADDGTAVRCPVKVDPVWIEETPLATLPDGSATYAIRGATDYNYLRVSWTPIPSGTGGEDWVVIAFSGQAVWTKNTTTVLCPSWLVMGPGVIVAQGSRAAGEDSVLREWRTGKAVEINWPVNHAGTTYADLAASNGEAVLGGSFGLLLLD